MTYRYLDASRGNDAHALPDVEVFYKTATSCEVERHITHEADEPCLYNGAGWYFAFGTPGCLWDSDPEGPYDTEDEAFDAARETAGFCTHGHDLDCHHPCMECAAERPVVHDRAMTDPESER